MPLVRRPAPNATPAEVRNPAQVLSEGTADQRWSTARSLGAVTGATEVALAAQTLTDALPTEADPRVREAIFTSLVRLGDRECVAAVVACLRFDDPQLRGGALDALRAMINLVCPVLPKLLADSDPDVRLLACDLARELPAADATQLLCEVLARETEANVCAAAVDVLAEIGEAKALPFLDACAARFNDVAFLGFAVRIAKQRIATERPAPNA